MGLIVETVDREALPALLPELARLRIAVFRAFPYLYDGDMTYEETYLARYAESPRAVVVCARDGSRLVGAATGTPLEDHAEDFGAAFRAAGHALEEVFYCAESVLLPDHRGQGAGHAFFDQREAHARALGRRFAAFCAVVRPDDHPARPAEYVPLDGFWRKRGYAPLAGVRAEYRWRDIGDAAETAKPMQVWLRAL